MAREIKKMVCKSRSNSTLTVREVALFLNIHVNTVRRWSELGVLKAYSIDPRGDRRFKREDILTFLLPKAGSKYRQHK